MARSVLITLCECKGEHLSASQRCLRRMHDTTNLAKHLLLLFFLCGWGQAEGASPKEESIHFGRDIQPILANRCYKCHGPDAAERQAELRLDNFAMESAASIVPGDAGQSPLYQRIIETDPDFRMPPATEGPPLTKQEQQQIARWIDSGAARDAHWAFVPPQQQIPPQVDDPSWPKSDIDAFVLSRLEREGLAPAPEANRRALIRRLSFDLRGLPPSIKEVEAFVHNPDPDAYSKLVETMLESPHYGERMAQNWLDLARYADTTGYASDVPRPMWLYRDWVIRSFNDNLPFDQFAILQLAGDMLPESESDDLIATGFHRCSMQALGNNPRKEEFRVKGIVDRVNTTARVFLGLTMGCAECHDHKFDPITQKEYYGMFAIFNNVPHYGENFEVRGPRIEATSPLAETRRAQIDHALSVLRQHAPPVNSALRAKRQAAWEHDMMRLYEKESSGHSELVAEWPMVDKNQHRVLDTPALRISGDFTIAAKVQTTDDVADIFCKYDSERGERGYVFGIGGEGEANAVRGHLYGWISGERDRFDGIQIYGSIPVNDGKLHEVALVFRSGDGVDLYVDGRRDMHARRAGLPPDRVAASECDLLIGEGYGLKPEKNKFSLEGTLTNVRLYRAALPWAARSGLIPSQIYSILQTPRSMREPQQQEEVKKFFAEIDRDHLPEPLRNRMEELEQERASLDRTYQAQVMQEMDTPRATHVMLRGNYLDQGEQVEPGVPDCLPPSDQPLDRLEFARWLFRPEHPLTARVAVNRIWQHYFGTGLVETADDFGRQGAWPSHPALLDYLAIAFQESGWNLKAMHRLIVNSAAYRQSAQVGEAAYTRDPANRLLARGPRGRLPAEQIRDNALAVGGLLSPKFGGPSVYPPQPTGILEEKGQLQYHPVWITSHGEDRYRRGLYVYWKRMNLYPSLATFGATTRERCTVKRPISNTPLQALVLLNDPVFVEAARALGRRIVEDAGPDPHARIEYAHLRCMGRPPTADEHSRYKRFVRDQIEKFSADPEQAAKWIDREPSQVGDGSAASRAAWTLLAATLLNLDETISKP